MLFSIDLGFEEIIKIVLEIFNANLFKENNLHNKCIYILKISNIISRFSCLL